MVIKTPVKLAILTRKMKTYRKVVLTKVTIYYKYHWMMTLTTQNGHQDSNVLHSSIQGAEGHVCS